jgi:hypothetical protein
MRTSSTASLLVAALVMLRHPCSRNRATARLLLERAAEHSELTPAEREACLNLADDLDCERPDPPMVRRCRPLPAIDPGVLRSPPLSLVPGFPFAADKGAPA